MTLPSPKEQLILNLLRFGHEVSAHEIVDKTRPWSAIDVSILLRKMIDKSLITKRVDNLKHEGVFPLFLIKITPLGLKTLNATEAYNAVMDNEI